MEHIGIDLGSSRSSICIVSADGKVKQETTKPTRELERWLSKRAQATVVMESCAESRTVALQAMACGHVVRVVPASVVRALGVGARKIKTDKRDAQNLALASHRLGEQLPSIHIKSDEAYRAQNLLNARTRLVRMRTASINFVRAQMRAQLMPKLKVESGAFADKLRAHCPELLELPEVEAHLAILDSLAAQIRKLDKEIETLAKGEVQQRLRKVTGVGPLVAVAFCAGIDDPSRFANGRQVASYLGLSPGENTTGGKIRRKGVIASGQTSLRSLLIQAAHSMMNARRTKEPMAQWATQLAEQKGRNKATAALARRLGVVMWAMMRDATTYDPTKTRAGQRRDKLNQELRAAVARPALTSAP